MMLLPWLKSPNVLLAVAIAAICVGLVTFHFTKISDTRDLGIEIGKGAASTTALESATKTAEAERQAKVEVGNLEGRSDIIALCKRSASCKERRTLK